MILISGMPSMLECVAPITVEMDPAARGVLEYQALAVDKAASEDDSSKLTTAVRGMLVAMKEFGLVQPRAKTEKDPFETFLESILDDTGLPEPAPVRDATAS